MYRVVALGDWAGSVVDRLRINGIYDYIRFVYCDTDKERLMSHGNNYDEHILLTSLAQCKEAIHDDCELMAVLVANLEEEVSQKYAIDIIYELWGYADYTYCFTVGYKLEDVTKAEGKYAELFRWISDYSNITVFQDNSRLPVGIDRYNGISQLLGLVLHHPCKYKSDKSDKFPFGAWATEKQLLMALQAVYSNNSKMSGYYVADTFTFHKSTHEY